jgi:hypothetical protein
MVPRQTGVTCRSLWPSWTFCIGKDYEDEG